MLKHLVYASLTMTSRWNLYSSIIIEICGNAADVDKLMIFMEIIAARGYSYEG